MDAKARKAFQKAMMAFRRVVFDLTRQIKAQARIIPRTKAKESSKKENSRKWLIPQSGLSASAAPEQEGHSHAWESDDWSSKSVA